MSRVFIRLGEVVDGFVAKHGFSADEAFEFGLDVILDGLERLRNRPKSSRSFVNQRRRRGHRFEPFDRNLLA